MLGGHSAGGSFGTASAGRQADLHVSELLRQRAGYLGRVGSAPRRNARYTTVYLSFVHKCNDVLNKSYPTVQLRFIAILAIGY